MPQHRVIGNCQSRPHDFFSCASWPMKWLCLKPYLHLSLSILGSLSHSSQLATLFLFMSTSSGEWGGCSAFSLRSQKPRQIPATWEHFLPVMNADQQLKVSCDMNAKQTRQTERKTWNKQETSNYKNTIDNLEKQRAGILFQVRWRWIYFLVKL